jgi:hypothetical protein
MMMYTDSLSKDKVGIERILPVFILRYLISKNVPVKTKVMMLEE